MFVWLTRLCRRRRGQPEHIQGEEGFDQSQFCKELLSKTAGDWSQRRYRLTEEAQAPASARALIRDIDRCTRVARRSADTYGWRVARVTPADWFRELCREQGVCSDIILLESHSGGTGGSLWLPSLVLCASLKRLLPDVFGGPVPAQLRVLELGSGLGLVGILCAVLLHPSWLVLTEVPSLLDILSVNIAHALRCSESHANRAVQVTEFHWGHDTAPLRPEDVDEKSEVDAPFHLILGADILYNPSAYDALFDTITGLASTHHTRVLIAYEVRLPVKEEAFFARFSTAGFSILRLEHGLDLQQPIQLALLQRTLAAPD